MTLRRSKPFLTRLQALAPNLRNLDLCVKVLSKRSIFDKVGSDGHRVAHAIFTVADSTGSFLLDAHDDWCDRLDVDTIVALNDVKVILVKDHMRLAFDKWSSVKETTIMIQGEILSDPNFSQVTYQVK